MADQPRQNVNQHKEPTDRLGYIEKKIDRILIYLFGDIELNKNSVGAIDKLQQDFAKLSARVEHMEERIEETEKKQIKYNVYTVIMWICLGAVAMGIFQYILQLLTTKK